MMVKYITTHLRIKNTTPKVSPAKLPAIEPKNEVVSYEGKPVGSLVQSTTSITLSLNKEELPQDKIQEFTDFMEKFLQS
jgi:hypothetical protein